MRLSPPHGLAPPIEGRASVALALLLALGASVFAAAPPGSSVPPFRDAKRLPQDYVGPGREDPGPEGGPLVLGWFGPDDPNHPDGGDAWRAVTLAVAEINAEGGVLGRPLRVVTRWADDPWRGGAANASRLVYEDEALALLGSIDGAATHLAEQIVVKARLPLVSPLATDPSVNLAGVAWMLSCLPGDDVIAPLLVDAAVESSGAARIALLVATDHDSRIAASELRKVCSRRAIPLARVGELAPDAPPDETVSSVLEARPAAILVAAPARTAARIVVSLRERGFRGTIVGSAPLSRLAFARSAGRAAEGVLVPLLREPGPAWASFTSAWQQRFGSEPDETAAQTYDAVRLTAAALARSGPNRALLLDALRTMPPWIGIMGVHDWDGLGRNRRAPGLGRWEAGRVVPARTQNLRSPP